MFGKEITRKEFLKKHQNIMKTRLKKTNIKKTGNKSIKQTAWEKVLFVAIQGKSNHVVHFVPDTIFAFKRMYFILMEGIGLCMAPHDVCSVHPKQELHRVE